MFKPIESNINFPALEEKLIAYWKENKIFEKSISQRPKYRRWTFLDGPPFVTGMPHYGSLLSSLPKDVFGRYFTMKGYRVRRVWGWDGHGLPVENKVEGELNIRRKKDIEEKIGIRKFIERCLYYVNHVSGEWEWYVDHIGRWVDFKNAYKTWDLSYMESVMWVFKQMYDKGFIYKGFRVSLYCPHCVTPISNFEVAMDSDNYKEIPDAATTYKYKLVTKNNEPTYILAWSTTPWNKIVTPALAVNPKLTYVKVKPAFVKTSAGRQDEEYYILAKPTLKMLTGKYKIIEEFSGKVLVGKKFEPHYDYYKDKIKPGEKAFEIIGGDFVTAEEGTGVVTIAAYGEEDLKAMQENNIHIEMHVDEEGIIKPDVPKFGGLYYLKANKLVNEDLASRGLIYKDEEVLHNVPLCWRCRTRLYYAPINAWYVNVQILKARMKETNEMVNWFPDYFKHGRFEKSLENAPDWNISRNRYWGSPVPVWECECGEHFVPGSIAELEERSGSKITNLHKPEIDEVSVTCIKCSKKVKRVSEVLDSWIEAGSASFAERHFPFDKKWKLEDFFPPDYIAEYTGQIRAWFYVLHVIGAALYNSPSFKNVTVTGVILGTDGRKMSKNFKNYPDPKEMLQKYGGDALRLYLLGSPVMHGEDILISEEQYRNQVRGLLLIFWNTYNFFVLNANVDNWNSESLNSPLIKEDKGDLNVLDEWILVRLDEILQEVTDALDGFDTVGAIDSIKVFIDDFSTWYIRRSRDRVGPAAENIRDKDAFYSTCYKVLIIVCKLLASIAPFITEEIFKGLTGKDSVHLEDWPSVNSEQKIQNKELLEQMKHVRRIVELGLAQRKEEQIKVRQPLGKIIIYPGSKETKFERNMDYLILDELNVKSIKWNKSKGESTFVDLDTTITPELKAEGEAREIVRNIQKERKKLGTSLTEKVVVELPAWSEAFENYIKKNALVGQIIRGREFKVYRSSLK